MGDPTPTGKKIQKELSSHLRSLSVEIHDPVPFVPLSQGLPSLVEEILLLSSRVTFYPNSPLTMYPKRVCSQKAIWQELVSSSWNEENLTGRSRSDQQAPPSSICPVKVPSALCRLSVCHSISAQCSGFESPLPLLFCFRVCVCVCYIRVCVIYVCVLHTCVLQCILESELWSPCWSPLNLVLSLYLLLLPPHTHSHTSRLFVTGFLCVAALVVLELALLSSETSVKDRVSQSLP